MPRPGGFSWGFTARRQDAAGNLLANVVFTIVGEEPFTITRCAAPLRFESPGGSLQVCSFTGRPIVLPNAVAVFGLSYGDPPAGFGSIEILREPDRSPPPNEIVDEALAIALNANFHPPSQ